MREDVQKRLKVLVRERFAGLWSDGWVYVQLKQEFDLTSDELDKLASVLGFKYGWNPVVEQLLEDQWEKDKSRWFDVLLKQHKQAGNRQDNQVIEDKLVELVRAMSSQGQLWLLEVIFNRYRK